MATLEEIKQLRDMTGAGINAVREALAASNGNTEEAIKYLRQKGMAKSDKRKGNEAKNGVLGVYVHTNSRVVVVVEVACETDFAAKSEDMLKFANDMALQVAAANPEFVNTESVSETKINEIKDEAMKDLEGKPENIKENIINGKIEKYYADKVLVKQKLFADENKTVEDMINELVAKIGEKILIKSFSKFEVAQDVVTCSIA
jgi:elongation factor Ts